MPCVDCSSGDEEAPAAPQHAPAAATATGIRNNPFNGETSSSQPKANPWGEGKSKEGSEPPAPNPFGASTPS